MPKRIEVKNVNSLKNIKTAIEHEIKRQKKELPKEQETRAFDESKGITKKMRSKEQAQDYRFISEPDLPVIKIQDSKIKIQAFKNRFFEILEAWIFNLEIFETIYNSEK